MPFKFDKRLGFVRAARSVVAQTQDVIQRIGNSIVGGDFTGFARGENTLDLQVYRTGDAQVASGDYAIAVGAQDQASGSNSIALGQGAYASASASIAIGLDPIASGAPSLAVGSQAYAIGDESAAFGCAATAQGHQSLALGDQALAAPDKTANLAGGLIVRRGSSLFPDEWWRLSGAVVVITSAVIDFKIAGDWQFTLPAGSTFWVHECGLVATDVSGLTAQPTVRFGVIGTEWKHLASTLCTLLTASGKRERFALSAFDGGETSLSAGVTAPATGTTVKGRYYWAGLFVEDET